MRTHVDNVHLHLLAKKDFVLSERVVIKVSDDALPSHGVKPT